MNHVADARKPMTILDWKFRIALHSAKILGIVDNRDTAIFSGYHARGTQVRIA